MTKWKGVYFAQRNPVIDWKPGSRLAIRPSPESLIKIGCSTDIMRRLKEMQTANSERLFVVGFLYEALPQYERHLHREYRDLRTSGEWFKPSAELVSFVAGVGIPDDFLWEQTHFWIRSVLRRPVPQRSAPIADNPEITV